MCLSITDAFDGPVTAFFTYEGSMKRVIWCMSPWALIAAYVRDVYLPLSPNHLYPPTTHHVTDTYNVNLSPPTRHHANLT